MTTPRPRFRTSWRHGVALVLLALAVLAAAPAPARTAAETPVRELWYRVEVDGQSAGWTVNREIERDDELVTEMELHLELRRGGVRQDLDMSTRFVESPDHRPVRATSRQRLGAEPQEVHFRFADDGIWVATGDTERRLEPPPVPWTTPFAQQREIERQARFAMQHDAGDPPLRFTLTGIDPLLGAEPVTTTWVLEQPRDEVVVDGETRAASRWRQSQSLAPQLETRVHLSPDGEVLRTATPMMGLELVSTLTTRQRALGHEGAPELLTQSLLLLDEPIPEPRRQRRAVYRLSLDDGGALDPLPSLGPQRVEALDDGALRVVVDLDAPPLPGEPPDGEHLRASAFLDFEHPDVRALHRQVTAGLGDASPARRAEALRRAVGHHLADKGLDSMLASAGEVARSRAGDCTEHAVLLAALLRADAVPSRVATGLVYVDRLADQRHLFGYHMWTQAWLGERWVDLDATLPPSTPFDATHVLFGTAVLADDGAALAEMAGLTPLIGRLQLEVVELGD